MDLFDRNDVDQCRAEIERLKEELRLKDLELAKSAGRLEVMVGLYNSRARQEAKARGSQMVPKTFGSAPAEEEEKHGQHDLGNPSVEKPAGDANAP